MSTTSVRTNHCWIDGLFGGLADKGKMTNGAERHQNALSAIACLSARELEVLRGIIQGGSNKVIGRALGISPRTAEIHRANLKRKLRAATTADVVRIGIYAGFDDAENEDL